MPIDPAEIENKKFRIVFRGYDVEAVDAFLDTMQADTSRLLADLAAAEEAATRGADTADPASATATPEESAVDRPAEPGPAARALRTLARAEEMAEQMIADAETEADGITARARAQAEEILAAAQTERGRVETELELQRQRQVGALVIHTQQLRAEIERLAGLERQYQEGLRAWLAEQQRLLEQRNPALEDGRAPEPAGQEIRPAA
jgi:DivIVA domain-containing protein